MAKKLGEGADEGEYTRPSKKVSAKHYRCGGTPTKETDWDEPSNWFNRNVPGWNEEAVIPSGRTRFPIIKKFATDIAHLLIGPGAKLTIAEGGKLTVDGLGKTSVGVINKDTLDVQGELTVQRTIEECIKNFGSIVNNGSIAVDKRGRQGIHSLGDGGMYGDGEILDL